MATLDANPLRDATTGGTARAWAGGALVAAGLAWCYAPTLAGLAERWSRDPQYSHGFLVPVFAAALLWARRDRLVGTYGQPEPRLGLVLIGLGLGLRQLAAVLDFEALDAFSLLPVLGGLVLLIGGRGLARWCWPAIAFLAFMLPLPYALEVSLAHPLRRLATLASTYALQTLGCPALAEGNVILVGEARLGVAEACSGLGMLMTFFALATALALVVAAPRVDRLALVASAVPIAVLANVARVTATGVAYYHGGAESAAARAILHDLAGWLMMPLALALLYLETLYLRHLLVAAPTQGPLPLARPARPRP